MSIDGLMPPNLVNMLAMIPDLVVMLVFAQHTGYIQMQRGIGSPFAAISKSRP